MQEATIMSDSSRDVASVSRRAKQTKREIEQLKSELQKLISVNLKADLVQGGGPAKETPKPEAKASPALLTVETERVACRSPPAARHVAATTPPRVAPKSLGARPKTQEPVKEVPTPRKRSYNVAEAREYIRKQREKNAEQSKKMGNTAANAFELKKQKLKELQMKTRELVAKNVAVKRERSAKSSERGEVQIDHGGNLRGMSTNALVTRNSRSRFRDNVTVRDKQVEPPKSITIRQQHLEAPAPVLSQPIDKGFCPAEMPIDLLKVQLKREHSETEHPVNNKKGKVVSEHCSEEQQQTPVSQRPIVKTLKNTQTQTPEKPQTPIWLQPQNHPYPYNFINTVKQKLQFALQTPGNYIDVSTQIDASEVKSKSRAELKEIALKSPVKYHHQQQQEHSFQSFASHKPPNLDMRTVDELELVPKQPAKIGSSSRVRLFEHSESDTSKNIPDISSESESKPPLSLDKVLNLKLEPQSYSSDFVINTESVPSRRRSSNKSSSRSSVKEASSLSALLPSHDDGGSEQIVQKSVEGSSRTSVISSATGIPEVDSKASKTPSETSKKRLSTADGFSKTVTGSEETKTISEGSKTVSEIATLTKTSNEQSSPDEVQSLKQPSVSLALKIKPSERLNVDQIKNITVKRGEKSNNSAYEVHLKFEAEVHLLNDFNESLKQFMAVERAFEDIKSKDQAAASAGGGGGNGQVVTKLLQNVDTQTSVMTRTSTTSVISGLNNSNCKNSSINYSRGSEILESTRLLDQNNVNATVDCENLTNLLHGSDSTIGWDSEVSIKDDSQLVLSLSNIENYNVNNVAGLSYNMFDQLIKDEDRRISHLRDIIKIREQALLDRTRTELVWLDVQRKQLLETGRIEEASLVKRKQRGVIVKHEQERNEMKKLDQMQKRASRERKIILKQQQSLIKSQLSTETMMSKIKVTTSRTSKENNRRLSGPLRVVQGCSDSSFSKISSGGDDVLSVSASQFMLGQQQTDHVGEPWRKVSKLSNVKKTLHMREAALQKRRKAAEELLRWHGKLLDEERKIAELEAAASTVIKQGKTPPEERLDFKGKQLNGLWRTLTGLEDKKYKDDKQYPMSQGMLESFVKSAKNKTKQQQQHQDSPPGSSAYSSAFEADESMASGRNSRISSISELMENLSKIEDEISTLGRKTTEDLLTLSETKTHTSQIATEVEKAGDSKMSGEEASLSTDKELDPVTDLSSNKTTSTSPSQISATNLSTSAKSSSESSSKNTTTTSSKELSSVKELSSGQKTCDLTTQEVTASITRLSEPISVKDAASDKDATRDIAAYPKKPEDSSEDVINKIIIIQPIDLSELIEEVKSSIKEQEFDFNGSSISEEIFSKISEAPAVVADPASINDKTADVSLAELVNQLDVEKIPSSAVSVAEEIANLTTGSESKSIIIKESDRTEISEDATKSSSVIIENSVKTASVITEENSPSAETKDSVQSEDTGDSVKTSNAAKTDSKTSSVKSKRTDVNKIESLDGEQQTGSIKISEVETGTSESKAVKNTSKTSEDFETDPSAKNKTSSSIHSEQVSIKTQPSEVATEPSEGANSKTIAESSENKAKSERKSSQSGECVADEQVNGKSSGKSSSNDESSSSSSSISTETKTDMSESTDWKVIDKGKDLSTAKTSSENIASKSRTADNLKPVNEHATDRSSETQDNKSKTEDRRSAKEEDARNTPPSFGQKESRKDAIEKSKDGGSSSRNGEDISEEISIESASTLHHLASDELSLDKSLEADKPEKPTSPEDKSPSPPPSKKIDVKKRVSEILADATGLTRGADKSPRLQDLYVTAYDVPSLDLAGSPERLPPSILGHEAEELLKKQLAIEQEIKQLEQQQKAQAALVFVREIPNKPPPPYKPPVAMRPPPSSVLPLQRKDISDIASYSSKVLFKAQTTNKIDNAKFSENSFKLITNRYIDRSCCEFLFNICKELAREHYGQFETVPEQPSWMYLPIKTQKKPLDIDGLDRYFCARLKEMFGFKAVKVNESSIVQWGRKKRDHVDEILVEELLAQEADWTTFDRDELIVKDEVTNDIMKLLVEETADLLGAIMKKKGCLY